MTLRGEFEKVQITPQSHRDAQDWDVKMNRIHAENTQVYSIMEILSRSIVQKHEKICKFGLTKQLLN